MFIIMESNILNYGYSKLVSGKVNRKSEYEMLLMFQPCSTKACKTIVKFGRYSDLLHFKNLPKKATPQWYIS